MAKKLEADEVQEVAVSKIAELSVDFGRADLNEVVAKLNEVIRAIK